LDVTLNGTEMSVLALIKQKPDSSREEIADKISKTRMRPGSRKRKSPGSASLMKSGRG